MSTELKPLLSSTNTDVSVTSMSGGIRRGRCLQFGQLNFLDPDCGTVTMTKEQVEQAVVRMQNWLNSWKHQS